MLHHQKLHTTIILALRGGLPGPQAPEQYVLPSNLSLTQGKQLKAQIQYGPCKIFKDQYLARMDDSYEMLKQKIE